MRWPGCWGCPLRGRVVDAYTLAFAALMLSTGAFADRAGASRAYALGIALFTLASAACGLAIAAFGALVSGGFVAGMRESLGIAAALFAVTWLLSFRLADPSASRA